MGPKKIFGIGVGCLLMASVAFAQEVTVDGVGANAKMNEFCAAMGLCNLKNIDRDIKKRQIICERYRENLKNLDGLQFNPIQKDVVTNYAYFPIVVDETIFGCNRDTVADKLAENNIFARKYFYPLTSDFDCFEGRYDSSLTPVAKTISNRVLTLPLYSELGLEDVDVICNIIKQCKSK